MSSHRPGQGHFLRVISFASRNVHDQLRKLVRITRAFGYLGHIPYMASERLAFHPSVKIG